MEAKVLARRYSGHPVEALQRKTVCAVERTTNNTIVGGIYQIDASIYLLRMGQGAILSVLRREEPMSHHHYPEFTEHAEWTVNMIFKLALEDSTYLTDKECPYSDETKALILRAVKFKVDTGQPPPPQVPSRPVTEDLIDSSLDIDLYTVFEELKAYGKTIGSSDQTERMAYFRTATSLLERLVGARERALGIKQVRDFQNSVLTIMEEVMSPDQRTSVMDRLRSVLARQSNDDDTQTTTDEQRHE